jgi:hypothetical protein
MPPQVSRPFLVLYFSFAFAGTTFHDNTTTGCGNLSVEIGECRSDIGNQIGRTTLAPPGPYTARAWHTGYIHSLAALRTFVVILCRG